MTRGVLIFAQNNAEIDYAKIALFAAKRVKEYLGVPVSLITDSASWLKQSQPDAELVFDQIIEIWTETHQTKKFYDGSLAAKTLTWKNLSRVDCCFLSPYDETLVIDSDFIISSTTLKNIWNNRQDFLIYKDSFDLANWRDDRNFRYLNQHSIPFYWATAFYFKKTAATWAFFDLIKNIKLNWNYYRLLYNIDSTISPFDLVPKGSMEDYIHHIIEAVLLFNGEQIPTGLTNLYQTLSNYSMIFYQGDFLRSAK